MRSGDEIFEFDSENDEIETEYEGQLKGQRIRNAANRAKKKEAEVLDISPAAETKEPQKTA